MNEDHKMVIVWSVFITFGLIEAVLAVYGAWCLVAHVWSGM